MDIVSPMGMTLWGLGLGSFVIGFSGAVMPGPVLAVTITHTVNRGVWAGPLIVLGHGCIEVALLMALLAGLGPILTRDVVSGLIGATGGLIMLYMGADMLRGLPRLSLDLTSQGGAASRRGPVADGLLLSAVNPYFIIWWATVGLSLLVVANSPQWGWWGVAVFYAGHISADLAWYGLVSLAVAKGRRWLSDKIYRIIVGCCAAMLLGFAVYFGVYAARVLGGAWA